MRLTMGASAPRTSLSRAAKAPAARSRRGGSGRGAGSVAEQHVADARKRLSVAREETASVEGRREAERAIEAQAAMRQADARRARNGSPARARNRPYRCRAQNRTTRSTPPKPSPRMSRLEGGRARRRSPACRSARCGRCSEKASSSVWVLPTKRAPASRSAGRVGAVCILTAEVASTCGLPAPVG